MSITLYKNKLKKLSKKYGQVDRWDQDCHTLEYTGFFESDNEVSPGRNGMNTLLRFETKFFECSNIHFKRAYEYSGRDLDSVAIYMETNTRHGGFGSDFKMHLELRSLEKNELCTLDIPERFWDSKQAAEWYDKNRQKFGYKNLSDKDGVLHSIYMARNTDYTDFENSKEPWIKFILAHYRITDVFRYRYVLNISAVKHMHESKNITTFIFGQVNTYESRPFEIKIIKNKEVKTTDLQHIGGETPGYYAHSENLCIEKSQVEAAKKFVNRLNKKTKES